MIKIKNIKVSTKLIISYVITIVLLIGLGLYSGKTTKIISDDYINVIDYPLKRLRMISELNAKIKDARIISVRLINKMPDDPNYINEQVKIFEEKFSLANQIMNEIKELIKNDPIEYNTKYDINNSGLKNTSDELEKSLENYYTYALNFFEKMLNGDKNDISKAYDLVANEASTLEKLYMNFYDESLDMCNDELTYNEDKTKSSYINDVIVTIIISVILIISAFYIVLSMKKSLNSIISSSNKISNGDLNTNIFSNKKDEFGQLFNSIGKMVEVFKSLISEINKLSVELEKNGNIDYRIDENMFIGDYKDVVRGINKVIDGMNKDQNDILGVIGEYVNGNFDANLKKMPGKKAILNETTENLQKNLEKINTDINSLALSASEGNLSTRINSKEYRGKWQDLANNLNKFVLEYQKPLEEIANVFSDMSRGDFNTFIVGEYKGNFETIKEAANFSVVTIQNYIVDISTALQEIANKNLTISIDSEYLGEFTSIKESINQITSNLGELTKMINISSIQVASNVSQISDSNMEMAQGATEQATAVEKLNVSIDTIFEQTKINTANANKTRKLALESKERASKGSDDMKKMLSSIGEINKASESISKIIKVIDDIAFQTNLLALNAAVEAARAGEHGKGFAVVAEEVRALAQRSKAAASETSELIETSMEKALVGSKMANKTSETLDDIVQNINNITDLIVEVANAFDEQYKSLEQINTGILQIASVAQGNTAVSEETASATQELLSQTETLKNLIGNFKIEKNN